jgi:phage baseplate assembly protein W
MSLYRGFSTLEGKFKSPRLVDEDLIKRDILNSFAIRKGEKVGVPEYGSSVLDLIMEPLTEEIKNLLIEEVATTIQLDPRVSLKQLVLDEFENGIQCQIELLFVKTNQVETLQINFNRQDGTVT